MVQSFRRISFDVSIEGERGQADLDLTLSICRRRGASYRFHSSLNHLYIPEDIDPEPFRKALEDCTAVSWVVKFPSKCLKDNGLVSME